MELEQLFAAALGIAEPWKILAVEFHSEPKRLDIKVGFERGARFEYENDAGEKTFYTAYDKIEKQWRHLNFFEHECYITAAVPRIQPKEGGIKMIAPPWNGLVKGFTMLFEALIIQMCKNMPVHNASKILGASDHKLWRVLDNYVESALYVADNSSLSAVGMDETSLKRRHNYITLFVDMNEKKTIFITEGKDHKTVKDFTVELERTGGKREDVREVNCDMSPAFIKGAKEELPKAATTFDKFHILKIINEAVDEVRREEARTQPALKKARYTFLKNKENLTTKQKEKREALSKLNLKSMKALHIRENFQEIYKTTTYKEFKSRLQDWYFWASHSKLKPMIKAAETIKNHWDGILRWKVTQINNGILEGLNSVIQAAKRKARGYKLAHFKVIAYLLTGKLDLVSINSYLPT